MKAFKLLSLCTTLLVVFLQCRTSHSLPLSRPGTESPQIISPADIYTLLLTANREGLAAQLQEIKSGDLLINNIHNPAKSCSELPNNYPNGYYFVVNLTGMVNLKYCQLDGNFEGTGGAWTRVAHLDMKDSDELCPRGLTETQDRRCVRNRIDPGCSSVFFSTHGHEYSHVCGRIKAYQSSHPSAFRPYIDRRPVTTLEDNYVDGVSLTHGARRSRQHIWTFAAAYSDESMQCSCSDDDTPLDFHVIPPFVGRDFFCETASRTGYEEILFEDDPLWDGAGCESQSQCCGFNRPPWFCKELPEPTTDNIEMRLCLNEDTIYGDILIESLDILVQ